MEHTNLFLFENEEDLETAYPDGKVNDVEPGVAYARSEEEDPIVYYNRMVTNYEVTVLSENKSGEEIAESYTILTPKVLDGNEAKVNIIAEDIEGYKPRHKTEKIFVSGTGAEHVVVYLAATSYTITVNHMFSGQSIACATTVEVEDVYEEDVVNVKIEPLSIPGYKAEAVYIWVSGDTTYDLEYEESAYEAIDLGLPSGTKWASMNVGAESPEGYGDYYAWGEIEPNKASAYTYENYRFYPGNDDEYTKYNSTDNKMTLDLADDAANVVMGGDWHMPTSAQCAELLDNTTSSWTTDYNGTGVAGMIFTSNNNGNSIFFPAAGVVVDIGSVVQGRVFSIWSSSRGSYSWNAWGMYGNSGEYGLSNDNRGDGLSVRGVIGDGPIPTPIDQGVA